MYDDSHSVTTINSTAQETIDSLHEETKRRNKRMELLRNKKKVSVDQPPITIFTGYGDSDELTNDDTTRIRQNTNTPRCIMTVRTQSESMESSHADGESSRSQIRKKRRKMNRKLRKDILRMSITTGSSSFTPGVQSTMSKQSVTSLFEQQELEPKSILRYDSVTIREYAFIPGDNPSVSKGVPLTIDWDYQWEKTFDLDAYEKNKKTPRRQIEMKIPAEIRSELLRKNGHSWKDIQASIKMANIARRQRTRTIETYNASKTNIGLKNIARRMRCTFFQKRTSTGTGVITP
jgi:hypothetical protein